MITIEILSSSIIGIFAFLCLLSSFFRIKFLSHFSLAKHLQAIYNTDSTGSGEQDYMHGMKALMMVCSISAHAVVYMGT